MKQKLVFCLQTVTGTCVTTSRMEYFYSAEVLRGDENYTQVSEKADAFPTSDFQSWKAEDTWSGEKRELDKISETGARSKKKLTWFSTRIAWANV